MARIRVLIADDHPIYRDGIVRAIERANDLELVAECEDGDEALTQIRALRPDVAVLEQQCLEQLAAGASVPQIAGRLILSQSTVKTHLRTLYEKLGVSDRAAAVGEGMRHDLVR